MRALLFAAVLISLGLAGERARADEASLQKLELRNSEVRHFSPDEVADMESQAVEGGKQQIQMSDQETRDAILRVKQELEKNRAQEAASGSDSDSSE